MRHSETTLSLFAVAISLVVLGGCGDSGETPEKNGKPAKSPLQADVLMADVTEAVGIRFVHDPGKAKKGKQHFMPRAVGSGAAFFDYDNDGRLDIYLLNNGGPDSDSANCLYHQGDDGQFIDVSKESGLRVRGLGMGVACGDVNNDGQVDLVLTEYGNVRLFLNRGEGQSPRFIDATEAAGLSLKAWGTSACFVDFDRDGYLDLVLVAYLNYDPSRFCADGSGRQDFCGPVSFKGRAARLFRNLGASREEGAENSIRVRFEDVTAQSGFAAHPGPGLGVFCADFDGDRWVDIFITNDGKPNHLWINQRDGTFKEEASLRGIAYNSMGKSEADMGIAIGDVDGDGNFDLFSTHLTTETHTLWVQKPRGIFEDRTTASKLSRTAWRGTGFGTVMADFNNDGALDLAVANGRVTRFQGKQPNASPQLDPFWAAYAERDQLLLNDGGGKFFDASPANDDFSGEAAVSRGLACGDFNNDGAMDLLVTRIGGSARLFKNVAPRRGHWLMVRAIDPALRRDAYGAEVTVRFGKTKQMRWINPGYSFLCSNDPRAHFGLGMAARVDGIDVIWPDGLLETFPGQDADSLVVLTRGEGRTLVENKSP